jgi:hypothetical protein
VKRIRLGRILWIGAAAILVAAALVALVAVLRGDFSDTDGRILGTLGALLFAGSTAVAGLALVERGARLLGWTAITVAGPSFAALVYALWDTVFDGTNEPWRWGWTGMLALLAALIATTARLLARTQGIERLAQGAGVLAAVAAVFSVGAIWNEDPGDTYGRVVAALWILAGLAYLLVPVMQRFGAAGHARDEIRLLAELDGIELVATRSRTGTIDARLEPGERLLLRRRS